MSLLAQRLLEIHDALSHAKLPHAFGGAIALAYCTEEPRGTRDLDVNVFVDPGRAKEVFAALPDVVTARDAEMRALEQEGQVGGCGGRTPRSTSSSTSTAFTTRWHKARLVPFEDRTIPVLDCTALAVFKALFNRTEGLGGHRGDGSRRRL